MRALCEKKQLKDFMNQNKKDVIFFSMFVLCVFLFWLKIYFVMCFDNLIKIYVTHHYPLTQAI